MAIQNNQQLLFTKELNPLKDKNLEDIMSLFSTFNYALAKPYDQILCSSQSSDFSALGYGLMHFEVTVAYSESDDIEVGVLDEDVKHAMSKVSDDFKEQLNSKTTRLNNVISKLSEEDKWTPPKYPDLSYFISRHFVPGEKVGKFDIFIAFEKFAVATLETMLKKDNVYDPVYLERLINIHFSKQFNSTKGKAVELEKLGAYQFNATMDERRRADKLVDVKSHGELKRCDFNGLSKDDYLLVYSVLNREEPKLTLYNRYGEQTTLEEEDEKKVYEAYGETKPEPVNSAYSLDEKIDIVNRGDVNNKVFKFLGLCSQAARFYKSGNLGLAMALLEGQFPNEDFTVDIDEELENAESEEEEEVETEEDCDEDYIPPYQESDSYYDDVLKGDEETEEDSESEYDNEPEEEEDVIIEESRETTTSVDVVEDKCEEMVTEENQDDEEAIEKEIPDYRVQTAIESRQTYSNWVQYDDGVDYSYLVPSQSCINYNKRYNPQYNEQRPKQEKDFQFDYSKESKAVELNKVEPVVVKDHKVEKPKVNFFEELYSCGFNEPVSVKRTAKIFDEINREKLEKVSSEIKEVEEEKCVEETKIEEVKVEVKQTVHYNKSEEPKLTFKKDPVKREKIVWTDETVESELREKGYSAKEIKKAKKIWREKCIDEEIALLEKCKNFLKVVDGLKSEYPNKNKRALMRIAYNLLSGKPVDEETILEDDKETTEKSPDSPKEPVTKTEMPKSITDMVSKTLTGVVSADPMAFCKANKKKEEEQKEKSLAPTTPAAAADGYETYKLETAATELVNVLHYTKYRTTHALIKNKDFLGFINDTNSMIKEMDVVAVPFKLCLEKNTFLTALQNNAPNASEFNQTDIKYDYDFKTGTFLSTARTLLAHLNTEVVGSFIGVPVCQYAYEIRPYISLTHFGIKGAVFINKDVIKINGTNGCLPILDDLVLKIKALILNAFMQGFKLERVFKDPTKPISFGGGMGANSPKNKAITFLANLINFANDTNQPPTFFHRNPNGLTNAMAEWIGDLVNPEFTM